MTYRYRNENTGDEVEYPQRNARLEMLPNWVRVPTGEPELAAPVHEVAEPVDEARPHPEPEPPAPAAARARPAVSAPKAVWVEYAQAVAQDSDESAAVSTLTKAALIDRYGKEN